MDETINKEWLELIETTVNEWSPPLELQEQLARSVMEYCYIGARLTLDYSFALAIECKSGADPVKLMTLKEFIDGWCTEQKQIYERSDYHWRVELQQKGDHLAQLLRECASRVDNTFTTEPSDA